MSTIFPIVTALSTNLSAYTITIDMINTASHITKSNSLHALILITNAPYILY